ncbi:MAG: PAS domain-containing sensor histidine kinase, partial [Proteobacteria bacterium]|nr:PAS domain-containing sensor histidine kinase [Pseudomonadota bacterium]
MNKADFQLQGVGDPRLAVHATSHLPTWLWSLDGTRILWANPVGADVFGAANASALASRNFGPADPHRRQVAQLAGRLSSTGAVRLERLRGFGAAFGRLVTCACTRLDFPNGNVGVLVTAVEPVGRGMPLVERLQRLVEGIDTPIAAFARDGLFVGASEAAKSLLGFHNLTEAGLDTARSDALRDGRVETPIGLGYMVLQRVGSGSDIGLVALLVPGATHHPAASPSPPPHEPNPEIAPTAPAVTPPEAVEATEHVVVEPLAESAQPCIDAAVPTESENTPAAQRAIATDDAAAPPLDEHHASAIEAGPHPPAPTEAPPAYEHPAATNEAPAEFALFDAFDESAAEIVNEPGDRIEQEPIAASAPDSAALTDIEPPPQPEPPLDDKPSDEPSPYVEAVADEPSPPRAAEVPLPPEPPPLEPPPGPPQMVAAPSATTDAARMPSWPDESSPQARRYPLRFMWQMDTDGRFSLGSDEFTRLIGTRTAAGFGRLWSEIAEVFGLDPEGRVAKAVATRDTWSGITLHWPVDGPDARLPVELSGLPIYDR